jgi:hypothetical protein
MPPRARGQIGGGFPLQVCPKDLRALPVHPDLTVSARVHASAPDVSLDRIAKWSARGQAKPFADVCSMSGLPPEADLNASSRHVAQSAQSEAGL